MKKNGNGPLVERGLNGLEEALNRECSRLWRSPGRWDEADLDILWALAVRQFLVYGLTLDEALFGKLGRLYEALSRRMHAEQRMQLAFEVASAVAGQGWPAHALLPTVFFDPDPMIGAHAGSRLAVGIPPGDGDPLAGAKQLLALARGVEDWRARRGLLAGLIALGDRRLLPELHGCWETLGPERRRELLVIAPDDLCICQVEFCLDWLESTREPLDRASLCGFLLRLCIPDRSRLLDLRLECDAAGSGRRVRSQVLAEWPAAEYARRIEPRLRALAAVEPEPRFLPMVLRAWGLEGAGARPIEELAPLGRVC